MCCIGLGSAYLYRVHLRQQNFWCKEKLSCSHPCSKKSKCKNGSLSGTWKSYNGSEGGLKRTTVWHGGEIDALCTSGNGNTKLLYAIDIVFKFELASFTILTSRTKLQFFRDLQDIFTFELPWPRHRHGQVRLLVISKNPLIDKSHVQSSKTT